jgi:hypothetical protein
MIDENGNIVRIKFNRTTSIEYRKYIEDRFHYNGFNDFIILSGYTDIYIRMKYDLFDYPLDTELLLALLNELNNVNDIYFIVSEHPSYDKEVLNAFIDIVEYEVFHNENKELFSQLPRLKNFKDIIDLF